MMLVLIYLFSYVWICKFWSFHTAYNVYKNLNMGIGQFKNNEATIGLRYFSAKIGGYNCIGMPKHSLNRKTERHK